MIMDQDHLSLNSHIWFKKFRFKASMFLAGFSFSLQRFIIWCSNYLFHPVLERNVAFYCGIVCIQNISNQWVLILLLSWILSEMGWSVCHQFISICIFCSAMPKEFRESSEIKDISEFWGASLLDINENI